MKKLLAIVIIFLFIGVAVAPSINANISDQSTQERLPQVTSKAIKVIRYEYKSDGSIEKKVLEMPQEEYSTFRDEYRFAQTIDEKLDLYKKYDFIPQNVSMDTLRNNFKDYCERVNTSDSFLKITQNLNKIISQKRLGDSQILFNINCDVDGEDGFTLRFSLGLSPIIGRLNMLFLKVDPYTGLKSWDFILFRASALGDILTNGIFGEQSCGGGLFFLYMMGFVGYILLAPFFILNYEMYLGFTQVTFAFHIWGSPYNLFHQFQS